ncbi:hypothetical protein HOY80DRAFT_1134300 [Tuber brumale]|nr:hypothetical protein HOY80DRAFT_1134300 [Tuber brumale]
MPRYSAGQQPDRSQYEKKRKQQWNRGEEEAERIAVESWNRNTERQNYGKGWTGRNNKELGDKDSVVNRQDNISTTETSLSSYAVISSTMSASVTAKEHPGNNRHRGGGSSDTAPPDGTYPRVYNSEPNSEIVGIPRPRPGQRNKIARDIAKYSSEAAAHIRSRLATASLPVDSPRHLHQVARNELGDASKPSPPNNYGQVLSTESHQTFARADSLTNDSTMYHWEINPFEESFASTLDPATTPNTIVSTTTTIPSPAPNLDRCPRSFALNRGTNQWHSGPYSTAILQHTASSSLLTSKNMLALDMKRQIGMSMNESSMTGDLAAQTSFPYASSPIPAASPRLSCGGESTTGIAVPEYDANLGPRKPFHHQQSFMPLNKPVSRSTETATDHRQLKRKHLDRGDAGDPAEKGARYLLSLANAQTGKNEGVASHRGGINSGSPNSYPTLRTSSGGTLVHSSNAALASNSFSHNPAGARVMRSDANRCGPGKSLPDGVNSMREISHSFKEWSQQERHKADSYSNTLPDNPTGEQSTLTYPGREAEISTGATRRPRAKRAKGPHVVEMPAGGGRDDEHDVGDDEDCEGAEMMTDEEKRKNFLERNRIAALKCRERKKKWIANLEDKVERFTHENAALAAQVTSFREEIVSIQTLLLAYSDCPVARSNAGTMATLNQNAGIYNHNGHAPINTGYYGSMTGMGGEAMAHPATGPGYY